MNSKSYKIISHVSLIGYAVSYKLNTFLNALPLVQVLSKSDRSLHVDKGAVDVWSYKKMPLDNRPSSAELKRAEQLKRWEESETNLQEVEPKLASRKIHFSSGCVFLAACAAGDKEEVLRLLEDGADINTTNVDGMTALHQVS